MDTSQSQPIFGSSELRLPKRADLCMETERGSGCAVNFGMNNQNKEQVILWRAAVMALGRALRHEYEGKQEEVPEHIRRLLTQLEAASEPKNDGNSN
jgi:hypothetical protein